MGQPNDRSGSGREVKGGCVRTLCTSNIMKRPNLDSNGPAAGNLPNAVISSGSFGFRGYSRVRFEERFHHP